MKQKKRIDKILQAVKSRVQDEVGSLLGTVFILDSESYENITKENTFDQLQGKQICAEMDITGDVTGKGCLLVGIKDAIRLGGTLIMLPESELDEVIGREEYSEEIEDSYGEIANIIAGSFTKDFEEMYPKSCRFVRKNQKKITPTKVELESDDPIENRQLYRVSWTMSLDGSSLGSLVMLFPAATFELEEETVSDEAAVEEASVDIADADEGQEKAAANSDESPEIHAGGDSKVSRVDFEKQKKRVDRILDECQTRLQNEVSGLLGVTSVFTDIRNYFVTKEEFFEDRVTGKQVIADMEVVGDLDDQSFFCLGIKDAIHLGGVLIMLPPSELEITVNEEEFGEDAQDAYGEVTNIVSGVYTAVFEELYTKKIRFIKKGLTEVVPLTVETESDEPFPDVLYYVNSLSLGVDGKELGSVNMLFPASMLDLYPPEYEEKKEEQAPVVDQQQDQTIPDEPVAEENKETKIDAKKHKARVDKLLTACQSKMQEEVSGLLGTDVIMANLDNKIVNKEDFFLDEVSSKQVIANMDVVGELEGQSYLSVDLKDAIRVGGILIMLPTAELDNVVAEEDFGDDAEDAFGEIANIISGVYTAVFEEQYTKSIRFIKKELQQVVPMKIQVESDEPIPDQNYYVSSMELAIGGTTYGKVQLLFPLSLLQLEGLLVSDEPEVVEVSTVSTSKTSDDSEVSEGAKRVQSDRTSLDILIIGDDQIAASALSETITEMGYGVKVLSFKDSVTNYIPGELKAIYLVMSDVNEQGFGTAIKISSACTLPIVAAGPGWTRTKVIKAVKYGVQDILLTPATIEDIKENINNNLFEMAA
ncbi:hypothetical protein [Desulforhopalus sp. 52FAK]